jgi:hypothetical protein
VSVLSDKVRPAFWSVVVLDVSRIGRRLLTVRKPGELGAHTTVITR